jgi:hypothetical protein
MFVATIISNEKISVATWFGHELAWFRVAACWREE